MSFTKFFNLGVRWVNTGMTQEMRRSGQEFQRMIDTEVKAVQKLNRELIGLKETERKASAAVRQAQSDHKARVATARAAYQDEADKLRNIRAEMAQINAQMRAQGRQQNPQWVRWHDNIVRIKGEIKALNAAETARAKSAAASVKAQAEAHKNALIPAVEKLERAQKKLNDAVNRSAAAKAAAPKGAAAINPLWVAHQAKIARIQEDIARRELSLRESGWSLQDARRESIAAAAVARKAVQHVRRTFKRGGARPSDMPSLMIGGVSVPLAADFSPAGAADARRAHNKEVAFIRNTMGAAVARLYAGPGVDRIRKAWSAQAERAGISRARAAIAGRDSAADAAETLRRENREVIRGTSRRRAELRALRRNAPEKMSSAAVTAEAEILSSGIAERVARGELASAERERAAILATQAAERARLEGLHASAAAAAAAAKKQKQDELFGQGLEPARFIGNDVQKNRLATLAGEMALKIPGVQALAKAWRGERSDRSTIATAEEAHRLAKENIRANREQQAALQETIKLRRMENAELHQVKQGIKSHVWSSLFDAAMKFTATLGVLRTVLGTAARAAEFHYRAQGLSTLLNATTGAGQGAFTSYASRAGYQSEVSPIEAMGRMSDLAAAGYSGRELGTNTEAIFNTLLAARGEVTAAGAFDLGISLDKAFGGNGKSMADLLDTTVMAANKFPMTVGKIRDAMSYATEAAVTSGQSLEETLITIGAIMPIAKTPSKAGTITRNAMMAPGKEFAQGWLTKMGIDVKDSSGAKRPLLDLFLDIRDKLKLTEIKDPTKLRMQREAIEYKLTGQRGQAIFAALERMPQLAAAALRGTPFEGMQFKDARDAVVAMRLSVSDAAGETRRMADEMRKTSYVLGLSFKASLERASIAAGTFILPARDAMLQVGKTLLDWVSSALSGGTSPGGLPPGSSVAGNLAGIGVASGVGYMALQTVGTVFGALRNLKVLTSAKMFDRVAELTRAGATLTEAIPMARAELAGLAASSKLATSTIGQYAAGFVGMLGPLTILTLGVGALALAFKSARDAALDFTYITEGRSRRRNDRMFSGIQTFFTAWAEGRLKAENGTLTGMTEQERKSFESSGIYGMTAAEMFTQGKGPQEVFDFLLGKRASEVTANWARSPAKQKEQLSALEEQKTTFAEDVLSDLLPRILYGKSGQRIVDIGALQLQNTQLEIAREARAEGRAGLEVGGDQSRTNWNFMRETGAKSIPEAISKATIGQMAKYTLDRVWNRVFGENNTLSYETRAKYSKMFANINRERSAKGLPPADFDAFWEKVKTRLGKADEPLFASQYDAEGRYIAGQGAPVSRLPPIQDLIFNATSAQISSNTFLKQIQELTAIGNNTLEKLARKETVTNVNLSLLGSLGITRDLVPGR